MFGSDRLAGSVQRSQSAITWKQIVGGGEVFLGNWRIAGCHGVRRATWIKDPQTPAAGYHQGRRTGIVPRPFYVSLVATRGA